MKNIVNYFHLLTESQRLPNMLGQRLYNMLGKRLYNMLGQRLYNTLGQHFLDEQSEMVLHRATNVGPTKIAA